MDDLDKLYKKSANKPLKALQDEIDVLHRVEALFKIMKCVKDGEWSPRDIEFLNQHSFITAKNVVYLVNISIDDYVKKKNKHLPRISKWISEHGGGPMIPFSADFEKTVCA